MNNETKSEHTPTPWKFKQEMKTGMFLVIGPQNEDIAVVDEGFGGGDTQFIVRAVNAHDDLVAAAQNARNVLAALITGDLKGVKADSAALLALRSALAKAEGK